MSRFSNVELTATRTLTDKFIDLGREYTDRVFLLGHGDSDSLALNDPYLVQDLEETLDLFANPESCPLIKAFLNCYYSGGRDIYLMRVAPMSEHISYSRRTTSWYQTYYDRLETTYNILAELDQPMIIVPIGADFEAYRSWFATPEGVDFFDQLATHCNEVPTIRYGLLPARLKWPNYLVDDPRSTEDWREILGDGREIDRRMYVGVIYGEGLFDRQEITSTFSFDLCATVAGSISRMAANLSPICEDLHDASTLTTSLTTAEADALAEAKFMVAAPTWEGLRGSRGGYMLLNDNSMAVEESDYAHLSVLRLAQKVVEEIRPLAESYIGSPGFPEFRRKLKGLLEELKAKRIYRDYKAEIYTLPGEPHDVKVDLALYPYLCHKWIDVSVELGPNRGFEVR